ncbi:hypothetical protein [Mesonia aquimarina]|uniref:hypothetical protein n=1 Tax=Mesonia aquimarina TaxID=1504967 RepID=UPI000EF58BCA|nr:hypothetical protein [Mesonia aquimarina]
MKKDIEIPEVKGVYLAAVREWNKDFRTHDWNVYILNENNFPIETVLIVSSGSDKKDITSTMRHSLKILPAKSFAKVELLQPEILKLNNEFSVSYFAENTMFHKKFLFKKNTIKESAQGEIPLMKEEGILAD